VSLDADAECRQGPTAPITNASKNELNDVVWGVWNTGTAIYTTKTDDQVSWFEPLPAVSLQLLQSCGPQ
jgi:hypothetical protein